MMLQQTAATARFSCLGDQCPDTCCKGWGMQLTQETLALYQKKAPELLEAVTSGEANHIMRRDPVTDYCVKLEGGLCGIHKQYGDGFLGDACHFYPRVTRSLGERVMMTLSPSCPEAARLMVMQEGAFAFMPRSDIRVPYSLKNYLPAELNADQAMALHQACLDVAADASVTPERTLMRLSTVARALALQPVGRWPEAFGFYVRMADGRLPAPEHAVTDPFHLLQALAGLIGAANATHRDALMQTVRHMETALGATIDWSTRGIGLSDNAAQACVRMLHGYRAHEPAMQTILRRYLQSQLSLSLFPFSGLGDSLEQRITIIGIRFATVKLALMAEINAAEGMPAETEIIRAIYSISRFMDHLADPALSLKIYEETGWTREPRLRALVGDA